MLESSTKPICFCNIELGRTHKEKAFSLLYHLILSSKEEKTLVTKFMISNQVHMLVTLNNELVMNTSI